MTTVVRTVLAFVLLAASPSAQEGAAPGKARWQELSEEQRALVRERYRAWKAMDPERRRSVETRQEALRSVREQLVAELPDAERRRIESLESRERKRALRPMIERRLEALREELRERLGEDGIDKQTVRRVRRALRDRTGDRLADLEERGVLPEGEAERLLGLSPVELGRELRRLNRLAILHDPPKELLLLPEAEREGLLALPPDAFHDELRVVLQKRPGGGRGRAAFLPNDLRDDAEGRRRRIRPPPREVMDRVLTPDEVGALSQLEPEARAERIHALLREKARAASERSPRARRQWEKIESLPPRLQQRRYLKLIDPTLDIRRRPR
ncbi:MAG: DUF3106 domain-containing protein [Planctomycetota bacterium JB042]